MSSTDLPAEYQTAEGLRTLANFLRSQNGVKSRSGIEHEKRVDYFKGQLFLFIFLIKITPCNEEVIPL